MPMFSGLSVCLSVCLSQVHLSLTLAKLHPDLTMPMFSGLSVCLSVTSTNCLLDRDVDHKYIYH